MAELVNHLVFADPNNVKAKALQADALEQLGYQSETAGWRNAYLSAAHELRHGLQNTAQNTKAGPDLLRAMDTELLFDYMGVRLDAERAKGKQFKINLDLPDRKEKVAIELKNSHLNVTADRQEADADLTLTMNRSDLNMILMKQKTFAELMQEGKIKHQGDLKQVSALFGMLDEFEYLFNIVTP